MTGTPRMGLAAVLARLLATPLGRRAIEHLQAAAQADRPGARRHHLRAATRLARKALTRRDGDSRP